MSGIISLCKRLKAGVSDSHILLRQACFQSLSSFTFDK